MQGVGSSRQVRAGLGCWGSSTSRSKMGFNFSVGQLGHKISGFLLDLGLSRVSSQPQPPIQFQIIPNKNSKPENKKLGRGVGELWHKYEGTK